MSKDIIKKILRENLVSENIFDKIKEKSATPKTEEAKPEPKSPEGGEPKKDNSRYEKEYSEIQRKLDSTMLKASQVMQAAGLGNADDSTARSLFAKKLKKEVNSEGGQYLFNNDEISKIIKIVNNPASYLNVKK